MRFPYQAYPVRGVATNRLELVYRPVVPIRLIGPGGDLQAYALLDTGADDILLPRAFLEPLGVIVPRESRAMIAGVGGGTIAADFAAIDLELRKGKSIYRWAATVGFCDGSKVILGQSGGLEYFLASFNYRGRCVTMQPGGALPEPNFLAAPRSR